MYSLKELAQYTNGEIVNGDQNTVIYNYSVNHNYDMEDGIYIPIVFHAKDREIHIIDAVIAGAKAFIINRNSEDYNAIIKEAKEINPDICILAVEDPNNAIYTLAKMNREKYINIPIIRSYRKCW